MSLYQMIREIIRMRGFVTVLVIVLISCIALMAMGTVAYAGFEWIHNYALWLWYSVPAHPVRAILVWCGMAAGLVLMFGFILHEIATFKKSLGGLVKRMLDNEAAEKRHAEIRRTEAENERKYFEEANRRRQERLRQEEEEIRRWNERPLENVSRKLVRFKQNHLDLTVMNELKV